MLSLSHGVRVCFLLIFCEPSYFSVVEGSPLRLFFNHIDLNGNDRLDAYELQQYFHEIEPENPLSDLSDVTRSMKRAMKQMDNKEDMSYQISWQKFRENYAELDTPVENGAPQVRICHLSFVEYFPLLSKFIYRCYLMALVQQ